MIRGLFMYGLTTSRVLRLAIAAIVTLCASLSMSAQSISNYAFTASSGTFTQISGTSIPIASGSFDDGVSAEVPIGFDFWYMGTRYTSFYVGTNGFMGLLNPSIAWSTTTNLTNNLNTGSPRPYLAPFWDDNDAAASVAASGLSFFQYQLTGTAGSRVLTVQWLNLEANLSANAPVLSMQVKIFESTGAIQFIYRPEAFSPNSPSASIGIQGPTSGQFLSLNNAGTSPIVSSATETTTIAGVPAAGQTYTFTPPSGPAAPSSVNLTGVSINGLTVN
ncbi:MAG: hypothetical protein ACKOAG_03995, partial [Candidatus Kapaibacterium sp.]